MSLGEAFIEVRADLRPFGRDLKRAVKPMVEAFERELNSAVGRAMLHNSERNGREVGDRISRGISNSLTHQFRNRNAFLTIASTLAGALDDGISALPTEVKAAIVAGILAASPVVAGALAAAVSAGVGVGLVGLGVLLASQFDVVQQRAIVFGRTMREELVNAARGFIPAIISALDTVETRFRMMNDRITKIFDVSSTFLEPLVQGLLDALESIINAIFSSLGDLKPFVDELGSAFATLGKAIADALRILISTGKDGQSALRDLVALVSAALLAVASLMFVLTKLWGIFRTTIGFLSDIAGPLLTIFGVLDGLFDLIDRRSNANKSFINTNTDTISSVEGLIVATKGETDAIKEYREAIEGATDAAKSNLELNVAWEESLDRIADALDKNGKTLDVHTEKGRANITEFVNGLKIAEERALLRVQRGEATSEQAAAQYQLEINQLRALATQAGISEQTFNALFDEIIATSNLRISTSEMGVDALGNALSESETAAQRLLGVLQLIKTLSINIGKGGVAGVRGFAEGDIVNRPTMGIFGESGPEVIIPLTKPGRAAQLAQQSGLTAMLGSGGPSQVMVFIGNEQLDSRMIRVVERSNTAQALALNHGGRQL